MKKMLCSLLTVLLLVSCFAGTVNAAERAMGKFDVTVKAGELKPAKTGFPRNLGISPDMWQVAILDTKIKKL